MSNNYPAERFPPGETIREEIEERGWTQADLSEITGINLNGLNLLINGKRQVTPETAAALGEAFGTGGQFWLNLETQYQLWKKRPNVDGVARRAKLYEVAPMKELLTRRWVEPSESLEVLEQRVCEFFEIKSLDEEPRSFHAARMTDKRHKLTKEQYAWLFRAKHLASTLHAEDYSQVALRRALEHLSQLRMGEAELQQIPRILADAGVRLVIVSAIPGSGIDGACIWLDRNSPVIVLSFRYDRIDWFWHTLIHEIKHVASKDGLRNPAIDIRLVGKNAEPTNEKPDYERAADEFASSFLVPKESIEDFIVRTTPLYSKAKIVRFAMRNRVHPGLVVGQLQFRGEIPYSHSREMLIPVREIITDSALTDGWGSIIAEAI